MKHKILYTCLTTSFIALGLSLSAHAAMPTPAGYWKTIDDETQMPVGIMHLYLDKSGKMIGRSIGGFTKEGAESKPNCTECSDSTYEAKTGYGLKKDQVKTGSIIMWGYTKDGNDWTDGSIIDPSTGKKYDSSLKLAENNGKIDPNVLDMTGKVLFFSRTQKWYRIDGMAGVKALCSSKPKGYTVSCLAEFK